MQISEGVIRHKPSALLDNTILDLHNSSYRTKPSSIIADYTAFSSTAVQCRDPAISFLVMLVSRNVFHVVSALQSILCLYIFFWLIRSFIDPTLAALIFRGPLQFLVSHFSSRQLKLHAGSAVTKKGSLSNLFFNFQPFELRLCTIIELCIPNNRMFLFFYFNGFWRENDVIRLTAKSSFRLMA